MDAEYQGHRANPAAMQQYSGLTYRAAAADARWLAPLLRLGVFPQGSMYPHAQRAGREVWRQRAHVVRHPTSHGLRVHNILARTTGWRFRVKPVRQRSQADLGQWLPETDPVVAVTSSWTVMAGLGQQIPTREKAVHTQRKHTPASEHV
jgi:hypothetical protein